MNVSVPEELQAWVQRRIDNGEFPSVSEYVLDLIRRDHAALQRQLSVGDIRRSIEANRKSGGHSPAEDVFARIEEKIGSLTG